MYLVLGYFRRAIIVFDLWSDSLVDNILGLVPGPILVRAKTLSFAIPLGRRPPMGMQAQADSIRYRIHPKKC